MAKDKSSKAIQNKHIYSRASYLYQAAAYLSEQVHRKTANNPPPPSDTTTTSDTAHKAASPFPAPSSATSFTRQAPSPTQPATQNNTTTQSITHPPQPSPSPPNSTASPPPSTFYASQPHGSQRNLLTHLLSISQKSQLRTSPSIKRSICKTCNLLLVPGRTSNVSVENRSRKGRKEWADVLVVGCAGCGGFRRFPVGARRQLGRKERTAKKLMDGNGAGERDRAGAKVVEREISEDGDGDTEDGMRMDEGVMVGES